MSYMTPYKDPMFQPDWIAKTVIGGQMAWSFVMLSYRIALENGGKISVGLEWPFIAIKQVIKKQNDWSVYFLFISFGITYYTAKAIFSSEHSKWW